LPFSEGRTLSFPLMESAGAWAWKDFVKRSARLAPPCSCAPA
jgi:hypothetical protein